MMNYRSIYKFRFLLILLVGLISLVGASLLVFANRQSSPNHLPKPNLAAATKTDFYVDVTDDLKGLGYPDSRKIVRDTQGNLYIAYRKTFPAGKGAFRIFMAKSTDNGQSWQVLNHDQPIETVGNYTQRVPSLAIDQNNTLHVVWYGLDASTIGENEREIKYIHSTDGGVTWSTWRNIAPVPGYQDSELWQEHPVIYVDANHVIYVVWQGEDTAETQIKLTKSTDGGQTWSKWQTINESVTQGFSRPVLVANHAGSTLYLLAYRHEPDQAQIVWSRSLDQGTTWAAWTPIAPDRQDQRHLSAAIDSQNHLHVVWRQLPDDSAKTKKVQIHYARFDGNQWTAPEIPAIQPDENQFFPSITVDTQNNPWIVWTATPSNSDYPTEDPTTGFIYYTTQSNGGWHAPTQLTVGTGTYASLIRQVSSTNPELDVVWLGNQSKSEGLICYYSLERALDASQSSHQGACEIATDNNRTTPSAPAQIGTPTKTPKPIKTAKPTKTPTATKTPKPTKTPTPTKTP